MKQELLIALMLLTAITLIASGVYILMGIGYAMICAGALLLILTVAALRGSTNQ